MTKKLLYDSNLKKKSTLKKNDDDEFHGWTQNFVMSVLSCETFLPSYIEKNEINLSFSQLHLLTKMQFYIKIAQSHYIWQEFNFSYDISQFQCTGGPRLSGQGCPKISKNPDNWIFRFTTEHLLTSIIGIFLEKSW